MTKIVVWGESLFQFYSLKPIVEELKNKNTDIEIVVPKQIKQDVADYLHFDINSIRSIDDVINQQGKWRAALIKVAQKFFIQSFIADNFSVMYKRLRLNGEIKLLKLLFPKLKKADINYRYAKFISVFRKDPFPGKKVLAITNIGWHYMLNGLHPLHCIMESWDHPVKRPFMINPDITYTWNDDLKTEILDNQGIENVELIFPLKFRYIEEFGSLPVETILDDLPIQYADEINRMEENAVVYIASVSARNEKAFPGEVALIKQIAKYCKENGKQLYVKPKPNGVVGEYDFLKSDTVVVGLYGEGVHSKCMLDDNYHKYRIALLKKAGLIINVFTTFALEASMANKSILQLDLERNEFFGHFAQILDNPHIQKYFLADLPYKLYNGDQGKLNSILDEALNSPSKMDYSTAIKRWIQPNVTLQESVNKIVTEIIK